MLQIEAIKKEEEKAKVALDRHLSGRVFFSLNSMFASITHSETYKTEEQKKQERAEADAKEQTLRDGIIQIQARLEMWQSAALKSAELKPFGHIKGLVFFEPVDQEGHVNLVLKSDRGIASVSFNAIRPGRK